MPERGCAAKLRSPGVIMRLGDFIAIDDVIPDMAAAEKDEALAELVARLAERHPETDRDEVARLIIDRERLGSTGIGGGLAIPHAKVRNAGRPLMVFGRSRTGIAFDALDGMPVHIFFLLTADMDNLDTHLRLLARISRLFKDRALRHRLLEAPDAESLYAIITEQDGCL